MKAPNAWSCLPCAFSLATKIPVSNIFSFLGHDGSDIWFPHLPDPFRRRGFHTSEMNDFCIEYGFSAMLIPIAVRLSNGNVSHDLYNNLQSRYKNLLLKPCIILEPTHAVYWSGTEIVDPRGITRPLESVRSTHVIYVNKVRY